MEDCLKDGLFYMNSNLNTKIMLRINNRIDIDKNDLSGELNSVINSYFNLKEMENRGSNDNKPTNDLGDVEKFMDDDENNN